MSGGALVFSSAGGLHENRKKTRIAKKEAFDLKTSELNLLMI
jgi:hypothetical protein